MLGVPFSVIVLWYIVGHSACGKATPAAGAAIPLRTR
jgi:hypothetical protein